MGFFDSKEEKKKKEIENFMEKYQLEEIDSKDYEIIKRIADDLYAKGLTKAIMALTFSGLEEQAKVGYLSALVEQNWIIIRKLDEISKKLDK